MNQSPLANIEESLVLVLKSLFVHDTKVFCVEVAKLV